MTRQQEVQVRDRFADCDCECESALTPSQFFPSLISEWKAIAIDVAPPPSRGTENPICSNSNWASASLNWFVCLHMHTPTSVCVYTYVPAAYNPFRMAEKALVPPICKWNTIFSYISLRYSRNVTYAESHFVWLAFDELWLPFMESDSRFWPLALS